MSSPEVLLGDALRVLRQLDAAPEMAGRVLELLGLAGSFEAPRRPSAPLTRPPSADLPSVPPVPSATPVPPVGPAPPTVRDTIRRRPPEPQRESPLTPLLQYSPADPGRRAAAPRHLPALDDVLPDPPSGDPGATDLLAPGTQRAILTALCRGPAPTGEPDLDAVVDRISRREPLRDLPSRRVPTTRRGVQVLVDYGPGMRPFTRDQSDVVRALRRLAGPDGFQVLRFAGCPSDGAGTGPVWTWRPYRPPLAGQPVVVLSDVGAGAPPADRAALHRAWAEFGRRLQQAGNQVVVLAPVPVRRFPHRLRAALPIVTWDRTTSAGAAVRAAARHVGGRSR